MPEAAVGFYTAALTIRPDTAVVYNNLSIALKHQGDPSGAIAASRKAIALEPKFAHAYIGLGAALREQKNLAGAVAAFQKAVEGERFLRLLPQAVEQPRDVARAALVVTNGVVEPPAALAGNILDHVGIDVDHAIAPTVLGLGAAGVQFVRVHRHDRIRGRQMIGAKVAESFDTRFDDAEAERVVRMRLERMTNDVGTIKFDAPAQRRAPELCRFTEMIELCGDDLHPRIVSWA